MSHVITLLEPAWLWDKLFKHSRRRAPQSNIASARRRIEIINNPALFYRQWTKRSIDQRRLQRQDLGSPWRRACAPVPAHDWHERRGAASCTGGVTLCALYYRNYIPNSESSSATDTHYTVLSRFISWQFKSRFSQNSFTITVCYLFRTLVSRKLKLKKFPKPNNTFY